MKLLASIILAESLDSYIQDLLEKSYKTLTGTVSLHNKFWSLSESAQKDRLFVEMKKLDSMNRIGAGVEVVEDMISDFLDSVDSTAVREDKDIQDAGKKLAAGKSSSKPKAEDDIEIEPEEMPAEDEVEVEIEPEDTTAEDETTKEPTIDQSVIITKGVHKGEEHKFVGKTANGLYKLKLVGVDADKVKYNGVGAAVKREDFKLVESLMSNVSKLLK